MKRTDLPRYNRRRQALDWLKQSPTSFRLVQNAFLKLGYPLLEDLCEKDDGFSVTREPEPLEKQRITMLKRFILSLLPGLFTDLEIPPCKLIKSEHSIRPFSRYSNSIWIALRCPKALSTSVQKLWKCTEYLFA